MQKKMGQKIVIHEEHPLCHFHVTYCVSEKKKLPELLCKICTRFDHFGHIDGQDNRIM